MAETQLASMFIGSADDGDDIDRGRPSDAGNMIHIVNPQTNEILDYITLDNIIDDTHKKSLESYIETYDAIVLGGDGFSYDQYLEKRNHIIVPDEDGTYQEFVLFEVDKYRDSEGRKTHFYAHATYLELKKAKVIYPTRREGFTLSQHAGWALNDTGWAVGIVESEGVRTFNIENHTNPYEFIKRIANEFEVEIRFRVEHDGRRITARYVDFLERIGDWKGREVEFGKDLDSIRRVEKQDIVTALLGLGPERDDGTRIEVLVTDEEALQRWGRVDEHGNLHHLIEPYEIQSERTEMTEEEARQYTRTALDKRINTQVTYETTILDLEEVPGLEHEKIRFGDTIRIKDTYFNPPLYLEARVYEIERSIKNKAKKDIKLGDYIEYTEEEVHVIWRQLRNQIRRRITAAQLVEYAEPKKIESSTPPPIKEGENPIWVDTSKTPHVPHVVIANEWVKMSPTEAQEVGAETPQGAQNKADSAEQNAKDYAKNYADGIDDDLREDLRLTAPLPTSITMNNNGIRASAQGTNRYAQLDYRGLFVKGGAIQIERPDGATWMEDGIVHQDFTVSGFDPHLMDRLSVRGSGSAGTVFYEWAGFYENGMGYIDGRDDQMNDVRDPDKGYTVRFQRYEFIHSSRYFVVGYRVANNRYVGRHRVRLYEGTTLHAELELPGGSTSDTYHPIVVDLGTPTFNRRSIDLRVGWLKQWNSGDDLIRFRVNRVYLTDFI